jgi:prolyl oligopeptidase
VFRCSGGVPLRSAGIVVGGAATIAYRCRMRLQVVVVALALGCRASSPLPSPAPARTVEASEIHFGISVPDPYRWMEGNDNPELTAWLRAQGDWTRGYLARLPGRDRLLARIRELGNATGAVDHARAVGDKLFYFRTAPGEQLAKVIVRDAGAERVLADPATLAVSGGHTSIDAFSPSPDGRRLAYNVSGGGSELAVIHVLEVATGKDLPDRVERVWGGLRVAWLPDASGFFYTQHAVPRPGLDPMLAPHVRLHRLGAPAGNDIEVLGAGLTPRLDVAPIDHPYTAVPAGSPWLVIWFDSTRTEQRVLVAPLAALDRSGAGNTPWRTVADYGDGVTAVAVHGDRAYLMSQKAASNRRIVSVSLAQPDIAGARVEVPEDPHAAIQDIAAARDALYILEIVDGRARVVRWPWHGAAAAIPLPFDGWVEQLDVDATRDGLLFSEQGWTHPLAYFRYDPAVGRVVPDALATQISADFTGIVTEEIEAVSGDGTRVPVSIVHSKDIARDGARPAIMTGYAGYGLSMTPAFSPIQLAWFERGGVIAYCHGRGGGEKGEAWHVDGMRERKMNGVHDFEACAQALIDAHLSSPAHLFAQGRSMGGVLVGRAITDRPDLFAAADIGVGIVNPLRLAAARNGVTQIPELGDPETEAGFRALAELDPYHHVVAARYPATMFSIGLNDRRVSPWMTGKMAARMQALTTSGKPIAIRVDDDAGHGPGATRDQAFAQRADVWSFFLAASGDPAFTPR